MDKTPPRNTCSKLGFWYALIGFHFLVGRKWVGLGAEVSRARARARILLCLIGFHFLILSLHLPST